MAELKRKDEELTTADLAGTNRVEEERRPQLVRDERAAATETVADDSVARQDSLEGYDKARTGNVERIENARPAQLFSDNEVGEFRNRWSNVQTGFVDEPRKAVEDADNLVASLMKKLAEGFANERAGLEKQWDRGDNVSTEDLRLALQRYRSFFDRLLKV